MDKSILQDVLIVRGGICRFNERVSRREPLTVVFFGTSVTRGEWPRLVTRWLQTRYPASPINIVNCSISGTSSSLGVFRAGRDVIVHQPGLVFVEFCNDVHDGGTDEVAWQMDGILYKIRRALPACSIILVHVPRQNHLELYARGESPPHIIRHEEIVERHGVASVHVNRIVSRLIIAGQLFWPDYAVDTVHPSARGHGLIADTVFACMEQLETATDVQYPLPAPLNDAYARACLVPIHVQELQADAPENKDYYQQHINERMPEIWTLKREGDTLKHEFFGPMIGIYDMHGPDTGSISVRIDRRDIGVFDRYIAAGGNVYRLSNGLIFANNLSAGKHTIEITLLNTPNTNGLPPVFMPGYWMESLPCDTY